MLCLNLTAVNVPTDLTYLTFPTGLRNLTILTFIAGFTVLTVHIPKNKQYNIDAKLFCYKNSKTNPDKG